jgi:hypothetical protein
VHATTTRPKITVTADGAGVVSHAGSGLRVDIAQVIPEGAWWVRVSLTGVGVVPRRCGRADWGVGVKARAERDRVSGRRAFEAGAPVGDDVQRGEGRWCGSWGSVGGVRSSVPACRRIGQAS